MAREIQSIIKNQYNLRRILTEVQHIERLIQNGADRKQLEKALKSSLERIDREEKIEEVINKFEKRLGKIEEEINKWRKI